MAERLSSKKALSNIQPKRAIGLAKEKGGFTIDARTGDVQETGVMVALGGFEQRHLLNTVGHKEFADYINSPGHLNALTVTGRHLGGWVSNRIDLEQTPSVQKELVLDVSRRFTPTASGRVKARRFAHKNKQEAIFNLESLDTEVNPLHPKNLAAGLELVPGTKEHYLNNPNPVGEPYFAEVVDPSKIGGPKKLRPAKGQRSLVF